MRLHRILMPALLAPSLLLLPTAAFATDVFLEDLRDDCCEDAGMRDDGRDVDGELNGDDVDGFLRVGDDRRFVLAYAYAIEELRLEGALRAEEQSIIQPQDTEPRVVLYFTDLPIPEEALGDIAKVQELANAGAIHGLEITIDPVRKKPRWTGRLLLGGDDANQVFRTRRGGHNFQLEDFEQVGQQVTGSIVIEHAFPVFDIDGQKTGEEASFAVEFDVAVDPAPEATNTLRTRQARRTPQAEILLSAVEALRENDLDKFKRVVARNSEIAFRVQGPDGDVFRQELLTNLPRNPERLRQSIDSIVFFGDRAIMQTGKIGGGAPREFIFLREDGQWKLSQG